MASNLGRGRGYSGKNKDIVRGPSSVSDNERLATSSNTSQKNHSNQPSKYDDGHSDIDRSVTKQMTKEYQRMSHNAPKQQHKREKYEAPGIKTATPNVHVLKKGERSNENVKYSQGLLRAISVSDENRQSVLFIDEKHHFLLKQVNLLSAQDDGILFNQKLQHIGEILSKQYKDHASLRDALDAIASAAILDSRVSVKVSLLSCSVWFSCYQLFGQKLHNMFIEALTDKIDGLEVSLEGADQYLVNTANLLSNIFTETKMLNEEELKIICCLIVQVSIELLECYTPLALKTLNIQLMVHGRKLYQSVPDKVESLSISARKLLIAKQPPAPSCRIWLTLLADQCLCRLEPLPKYLEDFYSVHLDESQTIHEEKTFKKKTDHNNYSDFKNANTQYSEKQNRRSDSSDIYSIQSNGEKNTEFEQKYSDDVFEERNAQHDSSFDSSGVSDTNASEGYDCHNSSTSQNFERKPRPILGAGARFGQGFIKSDVDFTEPPPPLNNVSQVNEDNIPVFCPSIPPPNFIPQQVTKQATSASQDSTDYWNTPPPPLPNNKKKDNSVTQTSSVLAKRLDLNSWRQETNGPTDYESDNSQFNTENNQSVESVDYTNEYCQEPETTKSLLDKIKGDKNGGQNVASNLDSNEQQVNPTQRSERKRTDQVFYERRQSGYSVKDTKSDSYWDETQITNLQITSDSKKSNQTRSSKGRDKANTSRSQGDSHNERRNRDSDKPKSTAENRTPRDTIRQKNERQSFSDNRESDEKENNGRSKESRENRVDKRTSRGDRPREKKTSDEDKDTSGEDRKNPNNGRRDQRGGGRNSNRDTMEVHRGASYWTHDDRCDKEYEG